MKTGFTKNEYGTETRTGTGTRTETETETETETGINISLKFVIFSLTCSAIASFYILGIYTHIFKNKRDNWKTSQ